MVLSTRILSVKWALCVGERERGWGKKSGLFCSWSPEPQLACTPGPIHLTVFVHDFSFLWCFLRLWRFNRMHFVLVCALWASRWCCWLASGTDLRRLRRTWWKAACFVFATAAPWTIPHTGLNELHLLPLSGVCGTNLGWIVGNNPEFCMREAEERSGDPAVWIRELRFCCARRRLTSCALKKKKN